MVTANMGPTVDGRPPHSPGTPGVLPASSTPRGASAPPRPPTLCPGGRGHGYRAEFEEAAQLERAFGVHRPDQRRPGRRISPIPRRAWSCTGCWPRLPAPSSSTTWTRSCSTPRSPTARWAHSASAWPTDRCGPSRPRRRRAAANARPVRSSGSTRAGWRSGASAPTCAPSACSSTRPGAPPCGPSWPGTGGGWARCATSTSCSDIVTLKGPEVLDPDAVDRLDSVVGMRMAAALADVASERGGARRFQLNEQMMVLWDGPEFKAKAKKPAGEVLPVMLHRAWHDLPRRGPRRPQGQERRQPPQAPDPAEGPPLRMRDGGPGRGRSGQEDGPGRRALQSKLGDLHDACYSIDWFEDLADEHRDLREPVGALVGMQRDAARWPARGGTVT